MSNAIKRSPAAQLPLTPVQEQTAPAPASAAPVVAVKDRAQKIADALYEVTELGSTQIDQMVDVLLATAKSSGAPELKSLEGPDVKKAVTNFRAFVGASLFVKRDGRHGDDPQLRLFAQLWQKTPEAQRALHMGDIKEGLDSFTVAFLQPPLAARSSVPSNVARPAKQA